MTTTVLICYNDDPNPSTHKIIRMTLPNEWLILPTKMVLNHYVKMYNAVYKKKLNSSDLHLAKYVGSDDHLHKSNDTKLYESIPSEELISVHIMDRAMLYVRQGKGIEYSSARDRPSSHGTALRMIEEASSFASDNQHSFHIDTPERGIGSPTSASLLSVSEDDDDFWVSQDKDLSVQSSNTMSAIPVDEIREDLLALEEIRSLTSRDGSRRTASLDEPLSSVQIGSAKSLTRIETSTSRKSFLASGSQNSKSHQTKLENDYFAMDTKSLESNKSLTKSGKSSSSLQSMQSKAKSDDLKRFESMSSATKSVTADESVSPKSEHTVNTVSTKTSNTITNTIVTVSLNDDASEHDTGTLSGISAKEDAALIRFRSILDWLGVQPSLYDGVVKTLQLELSLLSTDEEKHELVKKKLGALLEASYLNSQITVNSDITKSYNTPVSTE